MYRHRCQNFCRDRFLSQTFLRAVCQCARLACTRAGEAAPSFPALARAEQSTGTVSFTYIRMICVYQSACVAYTRAGEAALSVPALAQENRDIFIHRRSRELRVSAHVWPACAEGEGGAFPAPALPLRRQQETGKQCASPKARPVSAPCCPPCLACWCVAQARR